MDQFGVKELYTTLSDGKEWFCNWGSQPNTYTIYPSSTPPSPDIQRTPCGDKYDPMFYYRGNNGTYRVYGYEDDPDRAGSLAMWGTSPRIYLTKQTDRPTNPLGLNMTEGYGDAENPYIVPWRSLEMTIYSMVVPLDEGQKLPATYSGITIGCWTNHIPDYFPPASWGDYSSRCYYAQFQQNLGKAYHKKELFFNATVAFPKSAYPYEGQPFPYNVWIGMKFICRTWANANRVKLDMYLDRTEAGALEGPAGGTWEKIITNYDYDGWDKSTFTPTPEKECADSAQTYDGTPAGTSGSFWHGRIIKPDYFSTCHRILVRNDQVSKEKQFFKWFSAREIDDIPPPIPNTANYDVGNCIHQ